MIPSLGEDVEKREPICAAGRNVDSVAVMEKSMQGPYNIKSRTTLRSSSHTTGHIYKGKEISMFKSYLHSQVHCSIMCTTKV